MVVGALGSVTKRLGDLVKKIGGHITNTIFTKNRIVKNNQNPNKSVGYLKEGERIPLGPLVVGYDPIPWEVKRHKISL